MKVISFKVNEDIEKKLDFLTQKYDMPKSCIIRKAINKVFKEVTLEK